MSQITWRNVNSDMSAYQGRALEGAGRSLDSMFDKLTNAITRTQSIDDKNFETTKVNRTNDALNQIMGYANPEEFATAQRNGALQALMNSGQLDQQAVRTAMDTRLPQLQQRATQGIQYKNAMTDDRTAPLMDAARMAAINGDEAGAQALLGQFVTAGGRNGSQVAEFTDSRKQLGVTRKRDDTRFQHEVEDQVWDVKKARSSLLNDEVQRDVGRNSISTSNARLQLDRERLNAEKDRFQRESDPNSRANIEKQFAAFKENSAHSLGTYGTKEGNANLAKGLTELGITGNQRDDVMAVLAERFKNGVAVTHDDKGRPTANLPLPVAAILEEAAKSGENPVSWITQGLWSRRGDDLGNKLYNRFGIGDNGLKNPSNFDKRDQDLVDEMVLINKINDARTKGLYREGQDLEIKNPAKGSRGKYSGGKGGGFPSNPKVGDETTLPDKSTYRYTAAGWSRMY